MPHWIITLHRIIILNQGKQNLFKKFQSLKGSFKTQVAVVEEERGAVNFRDVASRTTQGVHTDLLEILPKPAQHKSHVNHK